MIASKSTHAVFFCSSPSRFFKARFHNLIQAFCILTLLISFVAPGVGVSESNAQQIECLVPIIYQADGDEACIEIVTFLDKDTALAECSAKRALLLPTGSGCFDAGGYYLAGVLNDPTPVAGGERLFILYYYHSSFCTEPLVPNPNSADADDACIPPCNENKNPFDTTVRACMPVQAQAESCTADIQNIVGHPINFITGEKYLIQTDYQSAGSFPLSFTRYFHSHNNLEYQGRLEWAVDLSSIGEQGAPRYPEAKVSFSQQINYSPYTDSTGLVLPRDDKYVGRVFERWRHNYDRYLLASFDYLAIDESSTPELIKLYRPNGKTEYYLYDNSSDSYRSKNGYTSVITRLDSSHELAPGWHVVSSGNEIEIYDLAGKFLRLTSASGLSHHLTYDAATQTKVVQVVDDFGQTLSFEYNDSNYEKSPTKMVDTDGNEYLYQYNAKGMLVNVTYPDLTPGNSLDNPSMIFHYEDANFADALTGVTDENGDRYSNYSYDSEGHAISTELANGIDRTEIARDEVNNTRTLTSPLGKQNIVKLNSAGLIESIDGLESPSGMCAAATQLSSYDSRGFRTESEDWNGNVTHYAHNDRGLIEIQTEAFGTTEQRTATTSWHPIFRLPTQVAEEGLTTTMTYDSLGHLLTLTQTDTTNQNIPYSTNGQSKTVSYSYYPAGVDGAFQLSTYDGPRTDVNDITTFEYTVAGFVSKVTNAIGHIVEITSYNLRGQPLTTVDENGIVTEMTYHPRGWLLTSNSKHPSQSSLDAITSFTYDNAGQVTRITLPNDSYLNYEYDAAHRLVAVSNNLNERIDYVLDNAGNITQESISDSGAQITRMQTRVFDELSRLYQSTGGANQLSEFSYDTNSNLLENRADPNDLDQQTNQTFDGLNRLIAMTDALNGQSEYGYDERNNMTQVTDERGLTTNYIYDGFDNLLLLDSPDTGITVYTYDEADNLVSQIDARGIKTQFSYDAINRVTQEIYPGGSSEDIHYLYDQLAAGYGIGRLTTIQDQTGSTAFSYDHRGNQIESDVVIQGNNYLTAYAYDLADTMVQTTYPSGRIVDHQLDLLGRAASVTTKTTTLDPAVNVVSNLTYRPFGPNDGVTFGNQLSTTIEYDQDYRLTNINTNDSGSTDVLDLNYTLNGVNNIEDIVNNLDANRSQVFEYDGLNRLTGAGGIYGIYYYSYDAVGNRLSRDMTTGSGNLVETYTYFADSNSIESIGDGTSFRFYQYDENGSVRSDGDLIYYYDQQNRMINVSE